ncbi:ankyrin repeat-containing protein [Tanacetum coccineum]
MAESSSAHDVSVREELEYTRASNVNVSNFVSVKLSGHSNYEIWNAQMVCLMESQNMGGIVKHRYDSPAAKSSKIIKQYNHLLKGWILGSLDEKVAKEFVYDSGVSAKDLWRNLKYSYGQRERSAGVSSPEYEEEIETTATITEHNENAKLMVKLPNLAQKDHWSKAKSILKKHKDAATEVIGDNGDTMLHLAVREGKNNFVEMLLTFKDDDIEIEKQNSNGQTALHISAIVGNKYAAELLLKKREKLLYIPDQESHVPLVGSHRNSRRISFYKQGFISYVNNWSHLPETRFSLEVGQHVNGGFHPTTISCIDWPRVRTGTSLYISVLQVQTLQLQQRLQIPMIEEVENIMEPAQLTEVNADNETPEMVFTREHANLVKEGEQWMKTTAESCSITAALIVTIVFAAAITVPGGNNQDTGLPLFKNEVAFNIFAVCDATSLFTAATALLVFLSILTARFSEKDFLVSLPRRLIIGLCLLSLSTTAMMVAFSAVLFLVFCDQRPWMLAPIGGLTCLPILAIVTLQLPLVVDLYQSTYSPMCGKRKSD